MILRWALSICKMLSMNEESYGKERKNLIENQCSNMAYL